VATDGRKNNDELGIDCGGSCPKACASCTDNIQNQGEVGKDCGGPCAAKCGTPTCKPGPNGCCVNSDCDGKAPYGGVCVGATSSGTAGTCGCDTKNCYGEINVNGEKMCELTCNCPEGVSASHAARGVVVFFCF